jgi:outer membrane protein OmpA-like peptidoglycan-associated protein
MFVPGEFGQTEAAVAAAEQSAGARYCPEVIAKAKDLGRQGVETYWACRTAEAMDLLAQAQNRAMTAKACTPGAMPAEGTCIIRLRDLNFAFDSAELTASGKRNIDAYLGVFKQFPSMKVEVGGHTDDTGPDDYNQTLSENRAKSVADYLRSKGITDQIRRVVGYGETKPMVPNNSKANRQKNRRVEVVVCE